jgi:rhodanese-related sulfurtransferase
MTVAAIMLCVAIGIGFFRYLPVLGVHCTKTLDVEKENNLAIVDVRDYNQSYKDSISTSVNIPVAYLNRYFHEIPSKHIHVVASTPLEKNISIRFLRKKGYHVKSYTLTECDCRKQKLA